jgi:hypothetical protein
VAGIWWLAVELDFHGGACFDVVGVFKVFLLPLILDAGLLCSNI